MRDQIAERRHRSAALLDGSGILGPVLRIDERHAIRGAFALEPGQSDAALLVTLSAGAYTIQVSGADNTTGIALIEVYEVP